MTERTELLARARASLYVVKGASGRPQVRLDAITPAEREALRAAIDEGLAELCARFAFDLQADVQRPFDVLAIVTADDGTEIVVDPLSVLPLLAPDATFLGPDVDAVH